MKLTTKFNKRKLQCTVILWVLIFPLGETLDLQGVKDQDQRDKADCVGDQTRRHLWTFPATQFIYPYNSLMEKMNGKIFLRDTRFQSTKVSGTILMDKLPFDQRKISERFLQLAFLLILEESVRTYECVYMYLYKIYI